MINANKNEKIVIMSDRVSTKFSTFCHNPEKYKAWSTEINITKHIIRTLNPDVMYQHTVL